MKLSVIFQIHTAVIYRFQHKVFGPFSFSFEKDVNYMITGLNGVGKTSFLKMIKGSLPLRSGKIEFHIDDPDEIYEWKRKHIGLVSFADMNREFLNKQRYYQQRFHAFDTDDFTVEEYLTKDGYDRNNGHHRSIIEKCGLIDLLAVERIKLSSGQTRKYLIAKAILKQPKILLLDNPYVGLDTQNRTLLNRLIDDLSTTTDIQFILSGQFTDLPKTIGEIIEFGRGIAVDQQKTIPENIYSYFKNISHWPVFSSVLELQNVNVEYEEKSILQDLNWSVNKGDKWSLFGQNGSGKSTLIGLIAADHPQAYKNNISLFGARRSNRDSIWDIKKNIALISSELHAYFHDPEMSCFSIVKQGLYETIYNNAAFTKIQEEAINALFNYFNIISIQEKPFNQCSTGEQRLILFLRTLIKNPPLLLLDEPFQGLDKVQVNRAKYLLEQILTPAHTMIFITHFEHEIPNTVDNNLDLDS